MTVLKVAPSQEPAVDLSRTYDAVVVGSGAAGGMAAHVLTSPGMQVLMLEAGIHDDQQYKGNGYQMGEFAGFDPA